MKRGKAVRMFAVKNYDIICTVLPFRRSAMEFLVDTFKRDDWTEDQAKEKVSALMCSGSISITPVPVSPLPSRKRARKVKR